MVVYILSAMIKKLLILSFMFFIFLGASHADGLPAAETVYKNVSPSIFMIIDIKNDDYKHPVQYGSSVAITPDTLATNCHVALIGDKHLLKINSTFMSTTLLYKDEKEDLCMLRINQKILKPVTLRGANTVQIGEEVFAIGSPKGYEHTISRGIISNKIKYQISSILQTDAALSPGSSGGGLFDTNGRLVGIAFYKNEAKGVEGIGFALPSELIVSMLKKISSPQPAKFS